MFAGQYLMERQGEVISWSVPTEAELAYAGSGGSEQRVYPWSSPPASGAIDDSYFYGWSQLYGGLGYGFGVNRPLEVETVTVATG